VRIRTLISAAAALAVLAIVFPQDSLAQRGGGRGGGGGNQEPAGPAPLLPNGKPDLTGHWNEPYTNNMAGRGGNSVLDPTSGEPLEWARKGEDIPNAVGNKSFDLPYTELGAQRWAEYDAVAGDYAGSCFPFGMSRNINSPHGLYMVHNESVLAFLFEQNTWHHLVPIEDYFEWPGTCPRRGTGGP
jgi:hypothetical protein